MNTIFPRIPKQRDAFKQRNENVENDIWRSRIGKVLSEMDIFG